MTRTTFPSFPPFPPRPFPSFRRAVLTGLLLSLLAPPLLARPCAAVDGGADPGPFTAAEAARFLSRHLAALDDREFEVHAEPAPLLRKVLLGHAHLKDASFEGPRYLVHANGTVEPYSLDAYVAALRDEKVGVPAAGGRDAGPREVAAAVVAADQPGASILQGLSDIPGYCRLPLERDFRGVVRPPWFYEDHGVTWWILYTYLRDGGGVVTRYRIPFRGGELLSPVTVLRIGERVGEHGLPE